MKNFYGYEEKRLEKIKPIVETPEGLKKNKRNKKRMQGSEEDGIISRDLNKNLETKKLSM